MRIKLSFGMALLLATTAHAQEETVSFPPAVRFETGDSWQYDGRKFRLFGVQACIRGTVFRAPDGAESDCGMMSIASLAALFSTGSVSCQPVGRANDDASFVVCAALLDNATVDVGTALISSGAAFAAVYPSGTPVSAAYAVAESIAKDNGSGLWSGHFTHPVAMLLDKN
ncbi:thermonuclease family protein (plasmid) [Nitratireductor rhodophyticola]|jgi:endonuclease YncB( thermonuclease family)|uniref:thermonuclease family protein n=1 Tax=Hyphomicrobiales TaxID=356 RepID=UPI001F317171|nr:MULTISPECIES: thermonuclease family protein [Hyphomicrobiales]WPZ16496.1 thermonuclease family protein [Nitratireductor rhodophyticola]